MSTEQTWQIESTSSDDTLALGEQIGRKLRGGEVIELIGDLGSGKTTFVKGLAKGIGSSDRVHSPSFTIMNQYVADKSTLYHYDLYRLQAAGLVADEIDEMLSDDQAVVVLEWGELVETKLPIERVLVKAQVTGETSRQYEFKFSPSLQYLFS